MNRRTFRDAQRERETVSALVVVVVVSFALLTLALIAGA